MPKPPTSPRESPHASSSTASSSRRPHSKVASARRPKPATELRTPESPPVTTPSKHGVRAAPGHVSPSSSTPQPAMTGLSDGAEPPTPGELRTRELSKKRAVAASNTGTTPDDGTIRSPSMTAAHVVDPDTDSLAARLSDSRLADEVDRLREAVNAQLLLSQQRERLSKQLNDRQKAWTDAQTTPSTRTTRVSPIREEGQSAVDAASPSTSSLHTASTESAHTVRGAPLMTPSYPFPAMGPSRGGSLAATTTRSAGGHHPFTTLSPTVDPTSPLGNLDLPSFDRLVSGSVTPASTVAFHPHGAAADELDLMYPTPNLYDLTLMLSAEPGLNAWWRNVTRICQDWFQAERVSLALPADSTDVENVPWGQKATFNAATEDDELSMGYLARGSSMVASASSGTNEASSVGDAASESRRPSLPSRHSFTSYEEKKQSTDRSADRPLPQRAPLLRSKSQVSSYGENIPRAGTLLNAELNLQAWDEHLAETGEQQETASWEVSESAQEDSRARVFPQLQAFDLEADPLIDSASVIKVLERGRLITLTREYPYLDPPPERPDARPPTDRSKSQPTTSRGPGLLGERGARASRSKPKWYEDEIQPTASPRYEEYEQTPPSPWSQSPAPSPAVRPDPNENPFFADASYVEESFNPAAEGQDYANLGQVEAIGTDRSWTVLHVPLYHVFLSKPVQSFRLDTAAMESRSASKSKIGQRPTSTGSKRGHAHDEPTGKRAPIAILSILSSVIPYPSHLRHALEHLAPHLATSFSLGRHHTTLETAVTGLSRRRPQTAGFGAVAAPRRDDLPEAGYSYSLDDVINVPRSLSGSITSPSDYSALSKSTTGSPAWDAGNLSVSQERRSAGGSPSTAVSDSYFSTKRRPGLSRAETSTAASTASNRRTSREGKDLLPMDARLHPRAGLEEASAPISRASPASRDADDEELTHDRPSSAAGIQTADADCADEITAKIAMEGISHHRRSLSKRGPHTPRADHHHTRLHSYGADFASTFQSLPTTAPALGKQLPPSFRAPAADSLDMLPPSDRLKGLMLDSLPAHVFVALPQTGEIVWVNSRYLTYRGQTVADLHQDPWASIHAEEREAYVKAWTHAIRTGEQFSMQVRIRRFDGNYRWFYTRAVGSRDTRGVIVQWYGSHMDIHDQHIAEVKAARQEEIEASEAKHRLLANLIPQIIFAATEDEGVTFANEQWLTYTGQTYDEALGLGFMNFVHPEDLAKCYIPTDRPQTPAGKKNGFKNLNRTPTNKPHPPADDSPEKPQMVREDSSSSASSHELPTADLPELARKGVIKVSTDGNGRLAYTTEMRLRSKVGEYRWHLVRCVAVDNINFGTGDGTWLCGCTDINDMKLLEAKLKEAMESKGKFLSNMSHEIRTPLIGISGMVSFLQDTVLNEEQIDYANTIQTSATSLLAIINDILDLSKVDAGMMKLSYEWFHPRSLIEDANELVSSMAIAKRLELNYIIEEDVPVWVKGDKVRIRQVLLNVIGNAIKFTSKGEVFSRCRVYRDPSIQLADNEIMLECSVVDTGRGFTTEEAELIFKPFSQIDGSSTRQHGGSGLGLVISRQLVELHGGKMNGTAIPNEGSTFTFTAKFGLPTDADRPDPSSISAAALSPATGVAPLEVTARALQQAGGNPIVAKRLIAASALSSPTINMNSPPPMISSGSSNPSVNSAHTDISSASSVNTGLVHFSEAARASGQDIIGMKLSLPDKWSMNQAGTLPHQAMVESDSAPSPNLFRPPMYSILVVCAQKYSLEATKQHIKTTLPKDVPHHLLASDNVADARNMIAGDDSVLFTHIVLNLSSPEEILTTINLIFGSQLSETMVVVLSDPVQRQAVLKLASDDQKVDVSNNPRIIFIFKPAKPSKFAIVFDPGRERDSSTDRNRSSAQKQTATRRQNYAELEKKLGHKGLRVLLVEDNVVNQKVLMQFLAKAGIEVELCLDGVECTEKVFAHAHDYYSIILCDLHMPRKDGYQTCRDIRAWEKNAGHSILPVVALSANVMADVFDKCVAAGFNSYVSKPVDFKELTNAMIDLLSPTAGKA